MMEVTSDMTKAIESTAGLLSQTNKAISEMRPELRSANSAIANQNRCNQTLSETMRHQSQKVHFLDGGPPESAASVVLAALKEAREEARQSGRPIQNMKERGIPNIPWSEVTDEDKIHIRRLTSIRDGDKDPRWYEWSSRSCEVCGSMYHPIGWCPAIWVLTPSAQGKVREDRKELIAQRASWRKKGGAALHQLVPDNVVESEFETVCRLCDGDMDDLLGDEAIMLMDGEFRSDGVLREDSALAQARQSLTASD